MKQTPGTTPKPQPLQVRIWRVFEYRRPLPIQRPRFTT